MKKILTLFMATVVAMSMMAIPQVKKAGNKTKPASKEQFEAKTPAQTKVMELAKDVKVVRNFDRPETAAKKLPAKPAMRVAAAQAADTITLHFDGFSVVPEWYEESGDWYMACSQGLWIVKFDILSESYVGTFTEEDLDLYYSYILTENDEYVDYEKVVLTISETQVSQYLTIINLHAVIDGSDGNVYVITCEHSVLSPKDELSHEITGATLTFDEWEGLVTLAGENADMNLTMAYWATWPTGRYTSGDLDMEATHVTYQGVEQALMNVDMVVASGMVDGVLSYAAEVNYYNQDTVLNHVSVVAPIAAATDTVHIEAYNLDVDDSWAQIFGWTYLYGSTSEWNIEGAVASWQAEEGEWAGEDEVMLYLTDMTIGETTEAIYATAEVVMDEEIGWKAHLEGLCKDGKYYVIDMKFEIPEATDTVVLSFPNSASAAFYPDLGNDLYLANENDEYFVALDIYGVPMGGEFTYEEMDTYYTQLVKYGETKDEYTMIQIAGVNGVVYQTGDTTWMKAEVTGFDAILYQVELWYVVPTPQETVNLTVEATFDNQLEANGYYTLSGEDEATGLLVAMSPITDEVAGTFVNDGVFGRFGEGQYDFYSTYTYVAKYLGVDEWGDAQYDIYTIEKGTLTVTLDEEDNILAHASVICSNGVQYEIEMTSVFEKPHLQYDAEYGVERIYTTDDIVTAEYDADYGMAFWQVEAADGSDVCALYFFLEEADAELVIPEGEYAINDSWDYGTVLASTGYDPYNGAAPSLYATYTEDGYLNVPLWFMVDGTVTVKHVDGQLSIEVNALNSYDQEVHIVYEAPKAEQPEPTYTENKLNTYAFGLESELSADQSVLTVTYRLNNSNATEVNVVVYNGNEVVITAVGTTTIGKNTVEIATAELPTGVELTWAVEVKGTSVDAPTREEKIYSFYHPSGVDIDINPENATFGMLIINEGMQSVASKTEGYVSAGFGAGIFAFTPSFDLIPNGELPGYNGGIEFTTTRADGTGTAYAPRRVRISEDGRIFVTSLNTDGNYLWEVNPDNLNEWTSIFSGTLNDQRELVDAEGNFVAAPNNGFDVKGSGENLQLAMYSVNLSGITAAAMSGFRLHEYNLGTATEWTTAPSKALVEGKYAINYTGTQVEYDNEGGYWIASYRGTASDANPGLVHINAEGVEDLKLVWNNVRQAGIRFNNDFTKLVVAGNNGAAKKATIYAVSKDENGAPVLTEETVIDMAVVGNNLNDFAWDYAGNLYACGNSSEKLAAWAMPYSGEIETPAASKYAFVLEGTGSDYEMYEDVITNLVIDYDNLLLIGGPSEAFQVEVVLGLGDYDRNTDAYQLLPASTISVLGSEAQFIDGYASVDGIEQSATAVVHCTWNGMALEFHLTMTSAPMEATKVVVENATVEIEKYLLWGDMYDYSLKMTGVWTNEGVDYPVLVEVPVYYPEATEPYEIYSTVTVGGWGDDDPWLGFGEGYLTITPEGQKITATGIVENPMAGIAIDITISGTITPTGVEDATVTVKPVKSIKNGQLIIIKDGKEFNVQGAIVK